MCKAKIIKELRDFDSFIELVSYFDSEQKCVQYLAELRWNCKPQCPYCEHDKVYELKGKYPRWKCAKCREQFSVRVGTIFEDSHVPLRKWFFAMYLATAHKKGISSHQLAKDIKVTQKTAWFMLHRIRLAFASEIDEPKLSGTVEIDETYVGGKEKNKHKSKRTEGTQGRSTKTKVPVGGILQRDGKIYAVPVENTKGKEMLPIIADKVEAGSTVYIDEYHPYKRLSVVYEHAIVQHSADEYVKDDVHTNSIESFWALFNQGIFGIYHHTSKKHLGRYVNEFTFRFNNREMTDGSRFDVCLANTNNKRITYNKLISKDKK